MKRRRAAPCRSILTLSGLWILVLCAACSSDTTGIDDREAPEGHTVRFEGVPHAPGADRPFMACAGCHGGDLRGGSGGAPGCFSCHGREW